ncbi:MAG: PstC family ABC transporter permease [Desulfovibrionaceae bacterium]
MDVDNSRFGTVAAARADASARRGARAQARRGAARERAARLVLGAAAMVSGLAVCAIFGFLVYFCLPLLQDGQLAQVFSWRWRPFQGGFGILPMVVGSLTLAVAALVAAYPVAIGVCCFAHGLGPARAGRAVLGVVRFMTSIPTVIYGFVSVFLLVPLIRGGFSGSGFCWLAALCGLSVLILPTLVLIVHAQFELTEPRVLLTSAALGLTPGQRLVRLTLPLSWRGLAAAAVLGFGRAVGDTIVPLMLAGNAAQTPGSPLDSVRTLTSHIALVVATDSHSAAYNSLFACGVILFGVTVAVNLSLQWLRRCAARSGNHG